MTKYPAVLGVLGELTNILAENVALNARLEDAEANNRRNREDYKKLEERLQRIIEGVGKPPTLAVDDVQRSDKGEYFIQKGDTDDVILDHITRLIPGGGVISKAAARRAADWHRRLGEQASNIQHYQNEVKRLKAIISDYERKARETNPALSGSRATGGQMSGTPA